jgi:uncharacterized membrane protein
MIPIEHIHPMLVHFPIVLIILLAAFDLIAALRGVQLAGRTCAANVATTITVLAAMFAVAAFFFGGMALDHAEAGGFHSDVAETHEYLGSIVAMALSAWGVVRLFLWWRNQSLSTGVTLLLPLVSIGIAALVLTTAYFGGQLVYQQGVNVTKMVVGG